MCGLAGEVRTDGTAPDLDAVRRMIGAMRARGPDAEGLHRAGRAALGHRRLKIIDLSDASAQPMADEGLGLAIVYNGAIYNYRDLRVELEALGHRFVSQGDTEVILRAFREWGPDALARLQGMFAFAIWDATKDELFLARDRLGIKPLYYALQDGRFRFASSLPALLRAGDTDTAIDPVALNHYMTFHAVVPPPRTILNGVRKLRPGAWMRLGADGAIREERYWSLCFGGTEEDMARDENEWQDLTLEALRRAVARRTVADVPVGVLLSGGLDSSLIVGLLAEQRGSGIKTFSVGFESAGGEEGNEFAYSDIVAERFATEHHKLPIGTNRTIAALPECIAAMSEPMVSHDNIGFYLLAEAVSQEVKVAMSGQGADEVFAGYHWYPPMMEATASCAVSTYMSAFFDRDYDEYRRAVAPAFDTGDASRELVTRHFGEDAAERPVDKALCIDQLVMLPDDPVKRLDNMTMAWGLEARVPFLDHELVELAARMPPDMKVQDGGKHVLKEAARAVIPHEVIDRPKGYFPVPALKHLEGPYLELVRSALHDDAARRRGLFNSAYVEELLADPESHITPLRGSKLWQIAALELWLQANGISA